MLTITRIVRHICIKLILPAFQSQTGNTKCRFGNARVKRLAYPGEIITLLEGYNNKAMFVMQAKF